VQIDRPRDARIERQRALAGGEIDVGRGADGVVGGEGQDRRLRPRGTEDLEVELLARADDELRRTEQHALLAPYRDAGRQSVGAHQGAAERSTRAIARLHGPNRQPHRDVAGAGADVAEGSRVARDLPRHLRLAVRVRREARVEAVPFHREGPNEWLAAIARQLEDDSLAPPAEQLAALRSDGDGPTLLAHLDARPANDRLTLDLRAQLEAQLGPAVRHGGGRLHAGDDLPVVVALQLRRDLVERLLAGRGRRPLRPGPDPHGVIAQRLAGPVADANARLRLAPSGDPPFAEAHVHGGLPGVLLAGAERSRRRGDDRAVGVEPPHVERVARLGGRAPRDRDPGPSRAARIGLGLRSMPDDVALGQHHLDVAASGLRARALEQRPGGHLAPRHDRRVGHEQLGRVRPLALDGELLRPLLVPHLHPDDQAHGELAARRHRDLEHGRPPGVRGGEHRRRRDGELRLILARQAGGVPRSLDAGTLERRERGRGRKPQRHHTQIEAASRGRARVPIEPEVDPPVDRGRGGRAAILRDHDGREDGGGDETREEDGGEAAGPSEVHAP
jgi:hypothetical protein